MNIENKNQTTNQKGFALGEMISLISLCKQVWINLGPRFSHDAAQCNTGHRPPVNGMLHALSVHCVFVNCLSTVSIHQLFG